MCNRIASSHIHICIGTMGYVYPGNTFHSSGSTSSTAVNILAVRSLLFCICLFSLFFPRSLLFPSHNLSVTLKTCAFFYQRTNCNGCWRCKSTMKQKKNEKYSRHIKIPSKPRLASLLWICYLALDDGITMKYNSPKMFGNTERENGKTLLYNDMLDMVMIRDKQKEDKHYAEEADYFESIRHVVKRHLF